MKGTLSSSQLEASNEEKASINDSDDERWDDDKLVIDLDAANMTSSVDEKKVKAAVGTAATTAASDNVDSNSKSKEQPNATVAKNGRVENTPLGKPKGKRGAQKKHTDNFKTESATNVKATGKAAKPEKPSGAKPGRKKREKQSPPTVKMEPSCETVTDDPYKFDPSDEKISSTATGKVNGKTKNVKGEQKITKDAQTEYDWRSVAVVTEPENLGPCEPGTQVCLEGIVWQETNNGVLVVNVTWKGKTYMGTLLDATRHDWSPPSCDSPTGDFEGRTPKGRGKRSRVPLSDTFKDINERKLRKEMRKQSGLNRPKSPNSPKSESTKRKGRNSECDTNSEPTAKRGRAASNNSASSTPHSPPNLIECPEPNCSKKYKQMNGLRYHQRNAHPDSSPQQASSDTTSEEADKVEAVSSPEQPTKSEPLSKKLAEVNENEEKDNESTDTNTESGAKSPAIRNNTTSVITPTTSALVSTTSPPTGNVPVATITPQMVKPTSLSTDSNEQSRSTANNSLTSSTSRPLAISAPPKLISKPSVNNSAMAPISTITSPSVYNSTLKPIQPKPTILGEASPNPGLHELMDQKKLKRKRSASKEELVNPSAYAPLDTQKLLPGGGMHRFETEHRGLLSTGGMINSVDPSKALRSPSYSDISDEGDLKNAAARRELMAINRNSMGDGAMYSQNPYPVATVSPQKNAPIPDKDGRKPYSRQTPSHSPVPTRLQEEKHQKQIPYFGGPQNPAWATMNPEFLHMMQMQAACGTNKDRSGRSISPKPSTFKPSVPPTSTRDLDNRASNDRLQLLKENMDMKASSMSLPRHGSNDAPRDYTMSPNTQSQSNDFNTYQDQKHREIDQDHHKREMIKNLSPANKMSQSATNKLTDNNRYEKVSSRSSPMPPPGSYVPPFMSNFLQLGLSANPMLSRGFPSQFLTPGLNYAHPHLVNMSVDSKDSGNSGSPSYGAKSGHKIHELDGTQSSKSPRPTSSGDRQLSNKNQPIGHQQAALQAAAAAMLGPYGPHVLPHAIAGLFPPPK